MKLYSQVCFGLVLFLVCPDKAPPTIVDEGCHGREVIRLTKAEISLLSDESVYQIARQNEITKKRCAGKVVGKRN